jgi:hypothetical protein
MEKYQLRMYYPDGDKHTAGSKATLDCSAILLSLGFKQIDVPIYAGRAYTLLNMLRTVGSILSLFLKLRPGRTVLIQYPLLGINRYLKHLVGGLKRMNCTSIILIHDVDSLRQHGSNTSIEAEISTFNRFDFVISHNKQMTAKLRAEGLKATTVELELFDYLSPDSGRSKVLNLKNRTIAFAGNLGKSEFLISLKEVQQVEFHVYGPGFAEGLSAWNVRWKGSFPPEELPAILDGGFGLIWDGDSILDCRGSKGDYLRYNNPHKASLYLVAGLPLIAPAGSAIAAYIQEKKIGLTVNSLFELPELLKGLSEGAYADMHNHVQALRVTLSAGGNLVRVIHAIETMQQLRKVS